MINEFKTRVARIQAYDLTDGDLLVTKSADYIGRIVGSPELDIDSGKVTFTIDDGEGTQKAVTVKRSLPVHIEIDRATS